MTGRETRRIGIGLLGMGVVGSEVVRAIEEDRELWARRWDIVPVLRRAAVRDLDKARSVQIPRSLMTTSPAEVIGDPSVEVVVEVTGRVGEALGWVEAALRSRKHVITANKALMSRHQAELEELAIENDVTLAYESAVAGGVPLVRPLRDSLGVYGITEITGILNGTSHYMLTRMELERMSFDTALSEAIRHGFAEPDPTADVSGEDAACKLTVLARVGMALPVTRQDIYSEGIQSLKPRDLRLAARLGYRVKPIAVARRAAIEGHWELRVHPSLVAADSLLGRTRYEENGILVRTETRGDYYFSGAGAGGRPTAGAIMSDLLEIALRPGLHCAPNVQTAAPTVGPDHFVTGHYLRVSGEASTVRKVVDDHDFDILAMIEDGGEVALVTSPGTPASILSALAQSLGDAPLAWLRVESRSGD